MGTDFAAVAKLLASPVRSAVIDALMEGRALTAGELARIAGVRPSTVSEHLSQLLDGGLVEMIPAGRHHYYRLSGADIAAALESFSRICPGTPVRSLRASRAARSLRQARFCYDHLAGALGVSLLDQMRSRAWLAVGTDLDFEVTDCGGRELDRIGVDLGACRRARRYFARPCLDWSERREHLAGALGAGLAAALLERDWLRRDSPGRGVSVTDRGASGLRDAFGIADEAAPTEAPRSSAPPRSSAARG